MEDSAKNNNDPSREDSEEPKTNNGTFWGYQTEPTVVRGEDLDVDLLKIFKDAGFEPKNEKQMLKLCKMSFRQILRSILSGKSPFAKSHFSFIKPGTVPRDIIDKLVKMRNLAGDQRVNFDVEVKYFFGKEHLAFVRVKLHHKREDLSLYATGWINNTSKVLF